jgi:membrane protein
MLDGFQSDVSRSREGIIGMQSEPWPAGDAAVDGRGRAAKWPGDIPGRGWWDILCRVRHALARDHIWVAAAGVAFCTLFAAIPGVAVVLAGFGLFADPAAVHRHLEMTGGLLPPTVSGFLADQMQAIAAASTFHLGSAMLVALWSARAGASTLVSVFNLAYRERETRDFLHYQAVLLAVTTATCLFGLLAFALVAIIPVAADALTLAAGRHWPS